MAREYFKIDNGIYGERSLPGTQVGDLAVVKSESGFGLIHVAAKITVNSIVDGSRKRDDLLEFAKHIQEKFPVYWAWIGVHYDVLQNNVKTPELVETAVAIRRELMEYCTEYWKSGPH